ncbi:MAG: hypothetical protein M1829_004236 [Trizodia sp. TS-e1964]|nr:MAG: hypothetical protein M1829_004236 [Trizodia sp. TS-e1964]
MGNEPPPGIFECSRLRQSRRQEGWGGPSMASSIASKLYSEHPRSNHPYRLIGSIVFTVPAAYFLWNNGKKSRHGHEGHAEHHDNTDAYHNNSEETSKDESKNSPEGSSNNEAATTPADSDSSSESGDESGKDTPETSEDEGEKASTPKAATEDSTEHPKESTDTNAKHADDPAHSPNSKKSESTPDSAKIKKPVDPNRPQV